MVAVIRKKKSSSLGPFKAIQGKISFLPKTWFGYIKPLIVLLCFLVAFLVYSNWHSLLEGLDKTPIRSYALTHKTQFTTNSDIRETLSKNPTRISLKIFKKLKISYLKCLGCEMLLFENFTPIVWVLQF